MAAPVYRLLISGVVESVKKKERRRLRAPALFLFSYVPSNPIQALG
jgi:hypothetical protein